MRAHGRKVVIMNIVKASEGFRDRTARHRARATLSFLSNVLTGPAMTVGKARY